MRRGRHVGLPLRVLQGHGMLAVAAADILNAVTVAAVLLLPRIGDARGDKDVRAAGFVGHRRFDLVADLEARVGLKGEATAGAIVGKLDFLLGAPVFAPATKPADACGHLHFAADVLAVVDALGAGRWRSVLILDRAVPRMSRNKRFAGFGVGVSRRLCGGGRLFRRNGAGRFLPKHRIPALLTLTTQSATGTKDFRIKLVEVGNAARAAAETFEH